MEETLLQENVRLVIKNRELQAELNRIKRAIKRCNTGCIIDGNDMTDWGWTTHHDVNSKIANGFYDDRVNEARNRRISKVTYDAKTNSVTIQENKLA